jgi:hypothetical protein
VELLTFLRRQWDRAGAVLAVLVGVVMLIVGWAGVSGSGLAAEQIPYVISCGVGGLFVLGIGAVLWISADLRDEWHKLDAVEDAIRAERSDRGDVVAPDLAADPPTAPVPVAGPNGATANGLAASGARTARAGSRARATAQ